jgi:hypothetical protein
MTNDDASLPARRRLDPIHIAWAVQLLVVVGILAIAGLGQ